jgi:hypothetical protein
VATALALADATRSKLGRRRGSFQFGSPGSLGSSVGPPDRPLRDTSAFVVREGVDAKLLSPSLSSPTSPPPRPPLSETRIRLRHRPPVRAVWGNNNTPTLHASAVATARRHPYRRRLKRTPTARTSARDRVFGGTQATSATEYIPYPPSASASTRASTWTSTLPIVSPPSQTSASTHILSPRHRFSRQP